MNPTSFRSKVELHAECWWVCDAVRGAVPDSWYGVLVGQNTDARRNDRKLPSGRPFAHRVARGGGDLRVEIESGRIVEQWKARSDGGTWSLAELIDEVLPDLYRAVDGSALDSTAVYRFVTERRRGRWDDADEFFETLRDRPIPDQPLLELNDTDQRHRIGERRFMDRGLFQWIAKGLTSERRELQTRLGRVIPRLALSAKEIEQLSDNYSVHGTRAGTS